ncbi:DUF6508 domain-containing protein [Streptomyces sp. NPDC049879]|uniref:DUF6508 domain-containing protein n=1 Tax=Streptomyces sp. NPDC049879 TaxID=3365598 RepID=UPI00379D2FBE
MPLGRGAEGSPGPGRADLHARHRPGRLPLSAASRAPPDTAAGVPLPPGDASRLATAVVRCERSRDGTIAGAVERDEVHAVLASLAARYRFPRSAYRTRRSARRGTARTAPDGTWWLSSGQASPGARH